MTCMCIYVCMICTSFQFHAFAVTVMLPMIFCLHQQDARCELDCLWPGAHTLNCLTDSPLFYFLFLNKINSSVPTTTLKVICTKWRQICAGLNTVPVFCSCHMPLQFKQSLWSTPSPLTHAHTHANTRTVRHLPPVVSQI